MSMDRKKTLSVVRGYLLKEKRNTVLTSLFLCFVTVFLLIGNQLFTNVQTANRLNAEALEGRQHATYSDISEAEFQKLKACDFVVDAGLSFHLGQAEDGTAFDYIDESFRDLGATVAEANIKQVINGRWAQKVDEIIFTKNYMEKYGLELGDTVSVSLTATDADTGEVAFRIPDLTICDFFCLLDVFCFPGCVCFHVCRICKNQLAVCQALFYAYGNNFLKDIPKKIAAVETAASVLGNRRMVWNFIHDIKTKKPTVCHVHLNLF